MAVFAGFSPGSGPSSCGSTFHASPTAAGYFKVVVITGIIRTTWYIRFIWKIRGS